ncbi:unnamed protein product [Rotaria sordida]|uniref:Uncharacterized protein n=1 Tax=Rotaria sordida TaxID=392033 RepID=A0A814GEG8_9BILA|nr:unnamed protein product [Rotaria sordida]CAF0995256.1 unnamed protein product [Rotaria sordida]CAF1327797.1 unnamed protein product [Rotaria sordida]CAF3550865.1 unnamed protein product [Rotaria sordida]CAF3592021.1 unnamed protein product [Rotaria sordida]
MFIQRHFIVFIIVIYSTILATIQDKEFLIKNGPFGLISLKKNDTFVDWVRVPEKNYQQWIFALKVWRICSIVLGILCLIFAALVLTYIIHGFLTNSTGPFGCLGEVKSDTNLSSNFQQFTLKHEQQREQKIERHLPIILRNPTISPLYTEQLTLENSLK